MPEAFKSSSESTGVKTKRQQESLFLRACRKEAVSRTPVWLMRQAGRFMPEFRAIRAKTSFLELCKNKQLACEVTVMAVKQLEVDAAIIFADILLLLEPLGVGLEYLAGEGPVIRRPITSMEDVNALQPVVAKEHLGYVMDAITLTRRELPADIPLIGFAGAPFTIASYMIEGGSSRSFDKTKAFMYNQPQAWSILMKTICGITSEYLNAQIECGAEAVQLFDSWVGCLSPADYGRYVAPYSKLVIDSITPGTPVIHFGTGTSTLLNQMSTAGGDVIGVDWRSDLNDAWSIIGHNKAVQGNLDPCVLLADKAEIKSQAHRVLRAAHGRPGHIFNLGHGVLPPTNPDHVRYLVEAVHNFGELS